MMNIWVFYWNIFGPMEVLLHLISTLSIKESPWLNATFSENKIHVDTSLMVLVY